jgi:hypothetical protein
MQAPVGDGADEDGIVECHRRWPPAVMPGCRSHSNHCDFTTLARIPRLLAARPALCKEIAANYGIATDTS